MSTTGERQTIHERIAEREENDAADPPTEDEEEQAEEDIQPLGQEAPEIVDDGAVIGAKRLDRPMIGDAVTSFIGGMSIGFGAVALVLAGAAMGGAEAPSAAHLVSSLAFPIGFVILLVGKSELFTENFFLPVSAVLERRGTIRQLLSLWAVSLLFNLIGSLVFAVLIARPDVLSEAAGREMIELAEAKMGYGWQTAFVKALFGGWLMTLMTWLLVAAQGLGPRLLIIWGVATLIVLGEFNHVVISAAEIFMAMFLGAPITVGGWFTVNFIPALLGNLVGGLVFVTLLSYIQAYFDQD